MEPSLWPENLTSDRQKVIDELVKGMDFANQLKVLLGDSSFGDDESVPAEDLVGKVLSSFTSSISILNRDDSDEVSQFPATASPCWDGRKLEDSGDSSKSSSTMKDRRGCYKRRKTGHTWIKETPELVDDGYAWRKYGQKEILNAKYPRNYFRCTHKYDQGCQANKQVQKIQEDPPLHRITYNGIHTCKNLLKANHLVIDCSADDSSFLLSFNGSNSSFTNKQDHSFFMASLTPSNIKQEHKDEELPNPQHHHDDKNTNNQSTSSDYLFSTDDFSAYDHADVMSSGVNNSSSCTRSTHSFDMDSLMVTSVEPHFDYDCLRCAF